MKTLIIVALVVAMVACTAPQEPSGAKDILLEQLKKQCRFMAKNVGNTAATIKKHL